MDTIQTTTTPMTITGYAANPAGNILFRGNIPRKKKGASTVSRIKANDGTEIFYKDWGEGQPVVFSHGWPLSADAWDSQMLFLASQGIPRLSL
jgi:hypothetical protein